MASPGLVAAAAATAAAPTPAGTHISPLNSPAPISIFPPIPETSSRGLLLGLGNGLWLQLSVFIQVLVSAFGIQPRCPTGGQWDGNVPFSSSSSGY
jgi:hypothetical protein